MDDLARRLAIEQRKRLVASIMDYLERNVYPGLAGGPVGQDGLTDSQRELRSKVLDSIGTYHDFMLDVIKVSREDMVQNEETLRLLRVIHGDVRALNGRSR